MASSPESASTWNSCDALPPIWPVSAATARNLSPIRLKMRAYASYIAWYDFSIAALSTSNEYASFITNSRERMTPKRGRTSSRNLVWMWYRLSGSCL